MNVTDSQPPKDVPQTSAAQILLDHVDELQEAFVRTAIDAEVKELCGRYCERDTRHEARYQRWGTNPGSIRIGEQRIKIKVPRVRDRKINQERPLETYKAMHKPQPEQQDKISKTILLGISQRDYIQTVKQCANSFGLSASTVSRIFQACSAQALAELEERDLSQDTYVTLMLDGVYVHGRHLIVAIAITETGEKVVLGFVEVSTENADAVEGLLETLVQRGLQYDQGLLCVVDGSKGLRKAIENVFGRYVQIQRCAWHKRENVLSHLKKEEDQLRVKQRMNEAYNQDTYEEAKLQLEELHEDLIETNEIQAANSIREGMEETLTLHRLGVPAELRQSLNTTNQVENFNGSLKNRLRRIKYWMNSDQCHRWVAMAIQDIEPRFKKIKHRQHIPKLQKALLECVNKYTLQSTSNRF